MFLVILLTDEHNEFVVNVSTYINVIRHLCQLKVQKFKTMIRKLC